PGSPPTTVTEPGTNPPDSTRSSSPIPVGDAPHAAMSTWSIGTAASSRGIGWAEAGTTGASCSEFHAAHDGHLPDHLGADPPHSSHRNSTRCFAMRRPYARPTTVKLHASGDAPRTRSEARAPVPPAPHR